MDNTPKAATLAQHAYRRTILKVNLPYQWILTSATHNKSHYNPCKNILKSTTYSLKFFRKPLTFRAFYMIQSHKRTIFFVYIHLIGFSYHLFNFPIETNRRLLAVKFFRGSHITQVLIYNIRQRMNIWFSVGVISKESHTQKVSSSVDSNKRTGISSSKSFQQAPVIFFLDSISSVWLLTATLCSKLNSRSYSTSLHRAIFPMESSIFRIISKGHGQF